MKFFYRYSLPIVSVAIATALNMVLWEHIRPQVTPFYFVAVMLSAWFGGIVPGLLATLLSAFASVYYFVEPRYSLDVGFVDLLRLLIFLAVAIIINWLNVARENAQAQMRAAHAQLEQRVSERTTELTAANESLRREIAWRENAERELLDYQGRLRELSTELSLTEQRERKRLATQLHDSVGQLLSLAQMKLEPVSSTLNGSSHALAIRQTCDLLNQAIDETRTLTWELSPPVLHVMGLGAALEWLIEQTQKRYGIALGLNVQPGLTVRNDELKLFLFSAVRELLINTAKHARAMTGQVTVVEVDGELRVSVEDSGKGFDTSKVEERAADQHSFGLFSIRERLRHFHGRLEIESAPGRGARVSLVVPRDLAMAKGPTT